VQVVNGEPWFVDGELIDASWKGDWFFPKVITRDRVYRENPPRPLTLEAVRRMKPSKCLDTEDVMKLSKCKSRLTVDRHVWAGRLKAVRSPKTGKPRTDETRSLLFRADSVLDWLAKYPIKTGRPKTRGKNHGDNKTRID